MINDLGENMDILDSFKNLILWESVLDNMFNFIL